MKIFTKSSIKKLLALLICICSIPVPSAMAEDNVGLINGTIVTPCYAAITTATCNLYIQSQTATYFANIATNELLVDRVEIVAKFQCYQNGTWITFTTCTKTAAGSGTILNGSSYAAPGFRYRLYCTFKAYKENILQDMTVKISDVGYYS